MAFCKNCGAQLPDGTTFCSNCGQKIDAPAPQQAAPQTPQQQAAPQYQAPQAPQYQAPQYQAPQYQAPQAQYQSPQYQAPQTYPGQAVDSGKGLSIAALVVGILCIVGSWIPIVCYVTTILAILGVVFGTMGRKKSIAALGKPSGLATAGLVLGIIGCSFAALGLICTLICYGSLCSAGLAIEDMFM